MKLTTEETNIVTALRKQLLLIERRQQVEDDRINAIRLVYQQMQSNDDFIKKATGRYYTKKEAEDVVAYYQLKFEIWIRQEAYKDGNYGKNPDDFLKKTQAMETRLEHMEKQLGGLLPKLECAP